jgi:hypothetical protein
MRVCLDGLIKVTVPHPEEARNKSQGEIRIIATRSACGFHDAISLDMGIIIISIARAVT